jgi:hypothetical protein
VWYISEMAMTGAEKARAYRARHGVVSTEYNREYRRRNPDASRKWNRRHVEWVADLKRVPCFVCGFTGAPCQMDFDHRDPRQKVKSISDMIGYSRERIAAEIAKCRVLCARCHRIKTWSDAPRVRDTPRRVAFRAWLDRTKDQPCADCDGRFPPAAMDFDHRDPAAKTCGVTKMAHYSVARVLAEIAKCDLVCVNCHRLRTHRRLQRKR